MFEYRRISSKAVLIKGVCYANMYVNGDVPGKYPEAEYTVSILNAARGSLRAEFKTRMSAEGNQRHEQSDVCGFWNCG